MMERYPAMASRFRRILAMKRKAINEVLGSLEKRDLVHVDKRLRDHLVKQMVATLTFWLSHDLL